MLVITYSVNEYEPDKLLKIISGINSKSDDDIDFDIIIDSAGDSITIEWDGSGCDKIWSISNIELLATNEISDDDKTFKNLFEE